MRTSVVLGVSVLLIAALAGCSKSGSTSSAPSSAPSGDASAGSEAAPEPTPGVIKLDIKDAAGNQVSGDPVAGKAVFVQCQSCHTTQAGVNRVGPSLHGVIGRHSGTVPGFDYSPANKHSGKVWTEQELYVYLKNPQKEVPGTYMTFTGVKDDQKRADVIAYLQEVTK